MKIVYIIREYANPGGSDRVLSVKANYLVAHGYDVSIIAMTNGTKKPFFYFDPRIQFFHLDISGKDRKTKRLFREKVKAIFEEIQPDIAISTGIGNLSFLLSTVQYDCKKILEFHFNKYKRKYRLASLDKYKLGRIFNNTICWKQNRIARSYDRLVILTNEDSISWNSVPKRAVIYNPLSFNPKNTSSLNVKRLVSVGRYASQKGYDYLIDIWSKVEKDYPDWILSIYGSGRKERKIRALIEKLNIKNRVELNPPSQDIETVFSNSSIYAMTSRYEGFGLVLTEAMSCGLPLISYDCKCGPREIITDGEDGFLIEFKNSKQFISKLKLLLDDPTLREQMGTKANENSGRLKLENIMPQWEALFAEVLNG